MKRTFIAIPVVPSENLLKILRELQQHLTGEAIKWVEPGNLHLTLKFLGETRETQLTEIYGKLDRIGASFARMNGTLTGLDYFSINGNPSVLFSEISGMPRLEEIAKVLNEAMSEEGFIPDQRRFRPHLTFARIKMLRDRRKFTGLAGHYRSIELQSVEAEKMVLYESILYPEGPRYIPLHTVSLPMFRASGVL